MAEQVQVREIDDDEGQRLLRIIRRGTGSVVTWRRAQMVLLSAQGMPVAKIAEVSFTSPDRVRDVIHNFNADGFDRNNLARRGLPDECPPWQTVLDRFTRWARDQSPAPRPPATTSSRLVNSPVSMGMAAAIASWPRATAGMRRGGPSIPRPP